MKEQNIFWIIIVIVGIWLVLSLFSHDEVKLGNNYNEAQLQRYIGFAHKISFEVVVRLEN